MNLDQNALEVFSLITAGTLFVVAVLKKIVPKFMEGKEEIFSMLLPVVFVVAAKLLHAFNPDLSWVKVLLWAIGGGISAGISWDYAAKPLLAKLTGFLSGPKADAAKPADAPKPADPAKP
jgi:Na+/proline symporter